MKYICMTLKKNKSIVWILIIYFMLIMIVEKYMIERVSDNIYYYLTINQYILYIFHGFSYIFINYIIINNNIKNEICIKKNRQDFFLDILNIGIIYSFIISILVNSLIYIFLSIKGIYIEKINIIYTVIIMSSYFIMLYSIIMLFYTKRQIKSLILANIINLIPTFLKLIIYNDSICNCIIVNCSYNNIYQVLTLYAIIIVINLSISYIRFCKCDLIIKSRGVV